MSAMSVDTRVEEENLETGDLGLGEGLKPGAIPKDENDCDQLQFTMLLHTPSGVRSRASSVIGSDIDHTPERKSLKLIEKLRFFRRRQSSLEKGKDHGYGYPFPPYTEVPIGTSLDQQRKLFEQQLQGLMKKNGITDADEFFGKYY